LHSLIKMISRLQLTAAAGSKRQQQRPTERGEFIKFHQRSSLDEGRPEVIITPRSPSQLNPTLSMPIVLAIAATIEAEPRSIS